MKPHLQNRETHQIIRNTENSFIFQWRSTPSGSIYAGGLQRGRALKSCLSEFRHASGAAFLFRLSDGFISGEYKTSLLFFLDYSFFINLL